MGYGSADHEEVGSGVEGFLGGGGAGLVVGGGTYRADPWRHDGQIRAHRSGFADVGHRAHDAAASGGQRGVDPLGQDVGRNVIGVAGQHRDRECTRHGEPGPLGAVGETLHAGPQHALTAEGVHGQIRRPQRTQDPGRLADRGRDVVELEVHEHVVAEFGHRLDRVGAGRAVELQADLHHPEPGTQGLGHPPGLDQVVDVEHQDQPAAQIVFGDVVGYRTLVSF